MRVLVLTNHFSEFAGSEVVALEVAQWFRARGDQVVLATNLARPPMSELLASIELRQDIQDIDLSAFDLVWCQHGLLALLPLSAFASAAARPPLTALVSLSPFEPYEHMNGILAAALSARVVANSPETADDIVRRNHGLIKRDRIMVFHNAAPDAFWTPPAPAPSALRSLTLVSNHAPPELRAAKVLLEARGIIVRHLGMHSDYRRLQVNDIDESDALITIGKTVTYALARAKPTYVYDYFGGPGWLTRANFGESLTHNFSGRPAIRRLTADAIAAEIVEGFENAVTEMVLLRGACDLNRFRLDTYLAPLREAALKPSRWRAFKLQSALASPRFRAHLEFARQANLVIRRSYLLANSAALSERDHNPNLWPNRVNGGSSS